MNAKESVIHQTRPLCSIVSCFRCGVHVLSALVLFSGDREGGGGQQGQTGWSAAPNNRLRHQQKSLKSPNTQKRRELRMWREM